MESALEVANPTVQSTTGALARALRVGGVVAFVGVAMLLDLPLCPFAFMTRHPCPGCGLTRATFAMFHGDLHTALHLHPLAPIVTPVVVIAMAYSSIVYVLKGRWGAAERIRGKWITAAGVVLGVLMIALWISRFFGAFGGPVPVNV